jgi:hypothetical protein
VCGFQEVVRGSPQLLSGCNCSPHNRGRKDDAGMNFLLKIKKYKRVYIFIYMILLHIQR